MSDDLNIAIKAHRDAVQALQRRDQALARALRNGVSGYRAAQAFREQLGEERALTAEGIRAIARRHRPSR